MARSTREQARELSGDSGSLARGARERLRRVNFEKLMRRGGILLERGRKWMRRRGTAHPTSDRFAVFIAGSNRSGTQMVCRAVGNSPHGWDYPENNFVAFDRYTLRSDGLIGRLIRRAPAPIVVFGSILDSQFADELLARFEGSKVIWVYRRYEDAANSSATTWGARDEVKDWMRWVSQGELSKLGAQGKRVSAETEQLVGDLYREDLSIEGCACLHWYMRNQLYFDLELDQDPRVTIVQYEDAVMKGDETFRRVFDFLGFPYHPDIIKGVSVKSVGKHPWAGTDARIQQVCDILEARLDERYSREVQRSTPEG